jgi:hypothetical protein
MSRNIASIDDLQKLKQSQEDAKKLKFLSKEERQKLALERRQNEVKQKSTSFFSKCFYCLQ